jgi:4-amino-4-deoxy-L-arabinose transferase-like glycosyltransferase
VTFAQPDTTWVETREPALADRLRARAPLALLLSATAVLYLWGLGRSGYANEFYAAAVKAGTQSWKAFLFGSLDPSNFITVDKPPASLWLMELSGRVFGFSSWSMLVPEALTGVASVWLLYATVRRWFTQPAALLAGAILALTPVAALMFRFNNPDALLALLLVVAAYATTRAIERGSAGWLALAGAAVGLGFITKMMEAFLVLPALAAAYVIAAPGPVRRRLAHVLLSGLALVVAGGWWVALVELTPASARPYVGGSTGNSILDLIWGYNGLGRLDGQGIGSGGGFSGTPGLLRLFNGEMGTQISWLLPAALLALAYGLAHTARRPRTDRTRAALIVWGGWLVVTGLVFSYMSGVIHPYYTNLLAPPIAVLLGVAGVELWRHRGNLLAATGLALMLIATSAWSYVLLERTPTWHPALRLLVLVGGLAAAVALVAVTNRGGVPLQAALAALVTAAALAAPAAYTLATASTAESGSTVAAGPSSGGGGFGGGAPGGRTATASTTLAQLISASTGYRWAAATSSSMTAAPLELATGKAVMAIGGFTGSDNSITLAAFERLVAAHEIHYYVAGGGGGGGGFGGPGGRGPGGGESNSEIASWVASTFTSTTVGGATVYDLTSRAS